MPWVLSAGWGRRGPYLVLKEGSRRVLRRPGASFPLFLQLLDEVGDLEEAPGVVGVEEQSWRAPPWYEREVTIKVLRLEHPRFAGRILRALDGRAVRWNDVLGPVQYLLLELGITCCVEVSRDLRILDSESLPPLGWVRIAFLDEFGETGRPDPSRTRRAMVFPPGLEVPVEDVPDEVSEQDPDLVLYSGEALKFMSEVGILDEVLSGLRVPVRVDGTVLRKEGLPGLVEWSRLGRLPLDRVSTLPGIGEVLTAVEAEVAMRRRMLHRRGQGRVEGEKGLRLLLRADRAGHILTPRPSVMFGVHQLDFSSLYPSIIVRFNVSPETVNNPFGEARFQVPELGYRISGERGIVPEAVSRVLERRLELRRLRDASFGGEREVLDARQSALKWLLVASFGYLGFRKAPFGSIEAYESVTAMARSILSRAMGIARAMGYRVVHALVDGLWVLGPDPVRLAEAVTEEVGIELRYEGTFSWIAFLPSREGGGVPNRYVGFRDGELVYKGVMASRSDTPGVVAEAQLEALSRIGPARSAAELLESRDRAMEAFEGAAKRILSSDVRPAELLVRKRLGSEPWSYSSRQPHVRAASMLGLRGYVEFVYGRRPYPRELGYRGYSKSAYLRILGRAREEVEQIFRLADQNYNS